MASVFQPVPKTFRTEIQYVGAAGGLGFNIVHFNYSSGPPTQSDVQAVATLVKNAADANFPQVLAIPRSIGTVRAVDLDSAQGFEATVGAPTKGILGGPELPGNDCVLINGAVRDRYKGGKPRVYPPWGTADVLASPAEWDSTYVALCNTAWQGFLSAIQGQPSGAITMGSWVVVHRPSVPAGQPPAAPIPRPVVTFATNPIPGSQRRRIRRG